MPKMSVLKKHSDDRLTLRFGKWNIEVLRQDLFVYYDTFFVGQYKKLRMRPGDNVLDAGAGFGDFSILASGSIGKEGRVLAVEPSTLYYPILRRNIEQNRLENVFSVNVALSSNRQVALVERSAGASDLTPSPSITIPDLLLKAGIDHVDVAKIDIEGFEAEIFRDLSWTERLRELVMETHGPTRQFVTGKLHCQGFDVTVFDGRSMMVNTFESILQYPLEFLRIEAISNFVGLRHALLYPFRPPMTVDPSNDFLRIIYARKTKRRDTS